MLMNRNIRARNDHTMIPNEPHVMEAAPMDEMVAARTNTNNSLVENR